MATVAFLEEIGTNHMFLSLDTENKAVEHRETSFDSRGKDTNPVCFLAEPNRISSKFDARRYEKCPHMNETPLIFKTLRVGPCCTNCYLFVAGDTVVVVDPGGVESSIPSTVESIAPSAKSVQILLTHTHSDHFLGADILLERFPGSTLYVSSADEPGLYDPQLNVSHLFGQTLILKAKSSVKTVAQGDVLEIGPYKIEVIETPGHTAGGVVYVM
jgi:glyoxylase-like metal-dependent hydrolase (beta-lactamase superfamily II)